LNDFSIRAQRPGISASEAGPNPSIQDEKKRVTETGFFGKKTPANKRKNSV
jgi:hypothetical protein